VKYAHRRIKLSVRPTPLGFRTLCWLSALAVFAFAAGPQMLAQGDQPMNGTVTTRDGQGLAGANVWGSATCCPSKSESATTDKDGHFHLERPGTVVHISKEGFQPRTFVVEPGNAEARSIMEPAADNLALPSCKEPTRGTSPIASGTPGVRYAVPKHDAEVIFGKFDVDYVRHLVKPKQGGSALEIWFGVYAMSPEPEDGFFIDSEQFSQRNVMVAGIGLVGIDSRGQLRSGRRWRQTTIAGTGGSVYRYATPEEAQLFDRIVDSACWQPERRH
jgi:hypothetical protein